MFLSKHNLGCITLWYILLSLVNAQSESQSQSINTATSHSKPDPRTQFAITTTLKFALWNARLSVVAADATATTYFNDHSDPSRNNSNTIACHIEAYDRFTLVEGPSTAGLTIIYTECGTNLASSAAYNCPLTAPNTATCDYTYTVGSGTTTTSTITLNSSELEGVPVTIFAGIEKLNLGSAPVSTTSGRWCSKKIASKSIKLLT